MAIKWEDVDVMVTALSNEIRLCKAKPVKGGEPGAMFATDMSGDKTEKCVKAVMQYMLNCCREEKAYAKIFTIPGVCRLELTDLKAAPKSEEFFTLDQVAELLHEAFGDECACNFNGNDEWLPQACRFARVTNARTRRTSSTAGESLSGTITINLRRILNEFKRVAAG